ncbi:MAG: hypothetical protein HUU38_10990, partial [Anaerolineales bacterium]|nr:hypothetical protein [Anaerolineales bacterium]
SICLEIENQYQESVTRFNIALVFHAQGRLSEAIEQMQQVVELDELVQHPDLESDTATLRQLEAELTAQKGISDQE